MKAPPAQGTFSRSVYDLTRRGVKPAAIAERLGKKMSYVRATAAKLRQAGHDVPLYARRNGARCGVYVPLIQNDREALRREAAARCMGEPELASAILHFTLSGSLIDAVIDKDFVP